MPAARAPSTSASGVSPTCQVAPGVVPAIRSAAAKIAPSGLAEPISAEAMRAVDELRQPGLQQALVQRPVPVGHHDERIPRARSARSVGALSA